MKKAAGKPGGLIGSYPVVGSGPGYGVLGGPAPAEKA